MKKSSIIFLQIIVFLIGLVVLGLLLWEPQIEGRNINATNFEIYFKDPFLVLVYAGSIPFFIGLYQAIKILGYVKQNKIFSDGAVRAVKTIKYCAIVIIGFVGVEEFFILLNHGNDDPAGGIFMGLLIVALSGTVSITAGIFEKLLQNAVSIKSENDLTL